ncbi:uncharacterized protein TEOVI_000099000 [Trypanosoma equiperdum]|uniref:Uncharacterized protein n=2 Tax=Trypanozoon TaxID=39700 RepID=Q585W4_TRYB2|nr:hypothetical protein, conserved [Trypanosoma brucei brucei TREU927]AAX80787.1 hypothetical protein, conserved [Trypanosoma brucei]AAZ11925.1 hypothetical protein, conserved [Trypanosoma brucei brucei TREU927]SCU69424.1 hypothetical protein, conserved [Trypanosoma equiperdum]
MESSVASLMEHLNAVETRRRVVMMKRKEAETRLSFVTEEHQQLEQQRVLSEAREVELKKELDHLLEEQRQAQLQLMSGADTIRQSEVEETLLTEHVQKQVSKSETLVAEWVCHLQELDNLQKLWESDNAATSLQIRINALKEDIVKLHSEKERLEKDVKKALEASMIRGAGALNPAVVVPGPPTERCEEEEEYAAAVAQLREQLELEQRDLEELGAQNARQIAVLDREVADLVGRSTELEQWLTDTIGARDQTLSSIELLPTCLKNKLCVSCSSNS